jgi:hypothetical protein
MFVCLNYTKKRLSSQNIMPCVLVVIRVNKTGNVRINVTLRSVRVTIVAVKKAISIIYYECVSVFLPYLSSTQCACSLYCHVRPLCLFIIFTFYLINGTIFGKIFLNIKLILIFLQNFANFFILRRIQRDSILNELRSSCKVPVILVRF